MLAQAYQDWLPRVLQLTSSHNTATTHNSSSVLNSPNLNISVAQGKTLSSTSEVSFSVQTHRPPIRRPWQAQSGDVLLRKVICSATLMSDSQRLASLHLFHPTLFALSASTTRFSTPAKLVEYVVPCAASAKPSVLLRLLHAHKFAQTLCFTASVEASHRLTRLLQLVGASGVRDGDGNALSVAEMTSNVTRQQRSELIQKFSNREIAVLVCSDVMARGIDIAGVRMVINYDCPTAIRTYVHRVGRTARAGEQRCFMIRYLATGLTFILAIDGLTQDNMEKPIQWSNATSFRNSER
jgi:ATP-dependent RNA helicase DDX51/DBP6